MAERFKVDVFALKYAKDIGSHMERIQDFLERAVRNEAPLGARFSCNLAIKECRKLIRTLDMLNMHFREEIPKEKPLLRSVGEK